MLKKEKREEEEPNQLRELLEYNKALGELGANVENLYNEINSQLIPELLKAQDKHGKQLGRNPFNTDELEIGDIVFDKNTYNETGHIRGSIYKVQYLTKDNKSVLLARPKLKAIQKSRYPTKQQLKNTDCDEIDCDPPMSYTRACLDLNWVSQIQNLCTSSARELNQTDS